MRAEPTWQSSADLATSGGSTWLVTLSCAYLSIEIIALQVARSTRQV